MSVRVIASCVERKGRERAFMNFQTALTSIRPIIMLLVMDECLPPVLKDILPGVFAAVLLLITFE